MTQLSFHVNVKLIPENTLLVFQRETCIDSKIDQIRSWDKRLLKIIRMDSEHLFDNERIGSTGMACTDLQFRFGAVKVRARENRSTEVIHRNIDSRHHDDNGMAATPSSMQRGSNFEIAFERN